MTLGLIMIMIMKEDVSRLEVTKEEGGYVSIPTYLPTYIGKVCITIRSGGSGISFAVPLHCSIETGIGEAGFPPNRLPVFSCFASGKGRSIVEGLCCSDTNASVQYGDRALSFIRSALK